MTIRDQDTRYIDDGDKPPARSEETIIDKNSEIQSSLVGADNINLYKQGNPIPVLFGSLNFCKPVELASVKQASGDIKYRYFTLSHGEINAITANIYYIEEDDSFVQKTTTIPNQKGLPSATNNAMFRVFSGSFDTTNFKYVSPSVNSISITVQSTLDPPNTNEFESITTVKLLGKFSEFDDEATLASNTIMLNTDSNITVNGSATITFDNLNLARFVKVEFTYTGTGANHTTSTITTQSTSETSYQNYPLLSVLRLGIELDKEVFFTAQGIKCRSYTSATKVYTRNCINHTLELLTNKVFGCGLDIAMLDSSFNSTATNINYDGQLLVQEEAYGFLSKLLGAHNYYLIYDKTSYKSLSYGATSQVTFTENTNIEKTKLNVKTVKKRYNLLEISYMPDDISPESQMAIVANDDDIVARGIVKSSVNCFGLKNESEVIEWGQNVLSIMNRTIVYFGAGDAAKNLKPLDKITISHSNIGNNQIAYVRSIQYLGGGKFKITAELE